MLPLPPPVHIVVDPDRVLNRITPAMYGACIEDVNHEIYGGLYAQRVFGESFEEPAVTSGTAGWFAFDGRWTSDAKGIHGTAGAGPKLVLDRAGLVDGTVEAQVAVSGATDGNAGLLVRVSQVGLGMDRFCGYEISLDAKANRLILGKHRFDFRSLNETAAPIAPSQWHSLKVKLKGPRIQVFLDGEASPRIDFTDTDQPLAGGGIALRTWQNEASFRAVKVNAKPINLDLVESGVSGMWDPVLTGDAKGHFLVDREVAFNGDQSQKIVKDSGAGSVGVANRGLNRWGISVRKGHTMEGRLYLRGTAPAMVSLQNSDGTKIYASQVIDTIGPDWSKAPLHLKPNATDANARLVVSIDKPGTLWVDQVVLLDAQEDRFKGLPVRKDIAQALVDQGVTFLRYGGTMINAEGYRWKKMIGDPDRRPPYAGFWYPHSTNGFGIFEFLHFCEAAGFKSAFAINVEESPEDVADLVDYFTAPTSNPWGKRRAEDGHPEPYQFWYIELGNEEAIQTRTHEGYAHYCERYRLLEKAIHARNPEIKLVCAAWWVPESPDMKMIFDTIDGTAAAWDMHVWSDSADAGTAVDKEFTHTESQFKTWNPNTTLKVVLFEENGNLHNHQRALGHATTLNATRRHGDFVLVDCAANCLQPWQQNDNGWDQGMLFFTPDHAWGMPPYDAHQLIAKNHLPLRIEATQDGDLDLLATKSEDGKTLVLNLVNVSPEAREVHIDLKNFKARSTQAWTLAGDPQAANQPYRPKAVSQKELKAKIESGRVILTLPPHSANVIRLKI